MVSGLSLCFMGFFMVVMAVMRFIGYMVDSRVVMGALRVLDVPGRHGVKEFVHVVLINQRHQIAPMHHHGHSAMQSENCSFS